MRAVATVAPPLAKPEWFARGLIRPITTGCIPIATRQKPRVCRPLIDRLEPARRQHARPGCRSGRTRRAWPPAVRVNRFDLSAGGLSRARSRRGPPVHYVEQDMRQPFGTNAFDLVFNLFTSSDISKTPGITRRDGNIAAALTGGGMLVLDYLNASTSSGTWSRARRSPAARSSKAHPLERGPGVLQADRDSRCALPRRSNTSSEWPS